MVLRRAAPRRWWHRGAELGTSGRGATTVQVTGEPPWLGGGLVPLVQPGKFGSSLLQPWGFGVCFWGCQGQRGGIKVEGASICQHLLGKGHHGGVGQGQGTLSVSLHPHPLARSSDAADQRSLLPLKARGDGGEQGHPLPPGRAPAPARPIRAQPLCSSLCSLPSRDLQGQPGCGAVRPVSPQQPLQRRGVAALRLPQWLLPG